MPEENNENHAENWANIILQHRVNAIPRLDLDRMKDLFDQQNEFKWNVGIAPENLGKKEDNNNPFDDVRDRLNEINKPMPELIKDREYYIENDICFEYPDGGYITVHYNGHEFQYIYNTPNKLPSRYVRPDQFLQDKSSGNLDFNDVIEYIQDNVLYAYEQKRVEEEPRVRVNRDVRFQPIVKKGVKKKKEVPKYEYKGYYFSRELSYNEKEYMTRHGYESLIAALPQLKIVEPKKIDENEEAIIMISELADYYATNELMTSISGFNIQKHQKEYQECFEKHFQTVKKFKQAKNG